MTNKITSPKYKLFVDNKSFYEETVKFIQITNPEFLTDQKPKLQAINACKMILSIANIKYNEAYLNNKQIFQFYYLNHLNGLYKELDLYEVGKLVHILVDALKCDVDLKKLCLDLLCFLKTCNKEVMGIDKLNLAPSHYCKFLNGIYSLKDNNFYKSDSNEFKKLINEYDFVSQFNFDFINVNKDDEKLIIYNKFKKDLANGDPDLERIFDELVYATAEGNGRKRYFMLSGQVRSGKTTFGNILKHIADKHYTQYITMDEFSNPHSLNTLDLSTKIVIGDDLQKSAKLVGPALERFKNLIDQNPLSLPVKYETNRFNRLVQTKAVWLQFIDDNPNIYEVKDEIINRTALIYIKGKNHRKAIDKVEREFASQLDELTGKTGKPNNEFIQKIICSTLAKLDYFYDFTLTDKMSKTKKLGYVYVISNPAFDNLYKIGYASDLNKRLAQYVTYSPYKYKLEKSLKIYDARSIEKYLHNKYKENKFKNEWFMFTTDEFENLISYIDKLDHDQYKEIKSKIK